LDQDGRNDGPQAHKIISNLKESKRAKEAPKNEVLNPWEL